MRIRRWLPGLALTLAILGVVGYALAGLIPHLLYGKRIAGQVVDAETGRGVAGAYVAFHWESPITQSIPTGHNSRDICFHAAATKTDTNGRFEINGWQKQSRYDVANVEPIGTIYAVDYVPHFVVLHSGSANTPKEHPTEHYVIKRFVGERGERLAMLISGLANYDCLYGGDSQKSLYPMLKALYSEARRLAETPDDRRAVLAIARVAAETALAQDPNVPWDQERTKAFIEENLE